MDHHVALLTSRNEIDCVEEFKKNVNKFFGPGSVYVMDDSDDGTRDILRAWDRVAFFCDFKSVYTPAGPRTDGQKQHLFSKILKDHGSGVWITVLNVDAHMLDDPNQSVQMAEEEGAWIVRWPTLNHFPHVTDFPAFAEDTAAWTKRPLVDRLNWYDSHRYEENLQFKAHVGQYYNLHEHARIIPHALPNKVAKHRPVLLHYPLRSPMQMVKRRDDRRLTGFRDTSYYDVFLAYGGFVCKQHSLWGRMADKRVTPILKGL